MLTLAMCTFPFGVLAQGQPDGATLYTVHCAVCHQPEGEGLIGMAPAIAGTLSKRAATTEGRAFVAQIVVSGMSGPIVSQGQRFNAAMPSFAAQSDNELATVVNYVLDRFNASPVRIAPDAIAAARARALSPIEVRNLRERLVSQVGE